VAYDGVYYWVGTDRFLKYNGVMQEVPNALNRNYFFDNINIQYRQKTWGLKVGSFGEIWWFFVNQLTDPDATECNHVIIYNVREDTWYDTPLPRSCGFSGDIYPYPIMFDTTLNNDGTVNIYTHERGVDNVTNGVSLAIQSYYESATYFSQIPQANGLPFKDNNLELFRYEPDFVMEGTMRMDIYGRKYPQSTPVLKQTETFTSATEKIDIKTQSRIQTIRFESNEAGGTYQQGQPLVLVDDGDRRPV
jgi:hypothetical protein